MTGKFLIHILQQVAKIHRFIRMKNRNAFTFLEVMFTLMIVGLIAALVIPIFFNTYGKKVMGTQLKKVCAQVTIAAKEIMADERAEDTMTLDQDEEDTQRGFYFTSAGVKTSDATQGVQYFLGKYLKHSKVNCGSGGSADCIAPKYRTPDKKDLGTIPSDFYCVKTVSAAAVCMKYDTTAKVVKVIVDANAGDKPNITGVDTFVMYITNDGDLKDFDENTAHCNESNEETATIAGYAEGCFTKIVSNGWVMPKD